MLKTKADFSSYGAGKDKKLTVSLFVLGISLSAQNLFNKNVYYSLVEVHYNS